MSTSTSYGTRRSLRNRKRKPTSTETATISDQNFDIASASSSNSSTFSGLYASKKEDSKSSSWSEQVLASFAKKGITSKTAVANKRQLEYSDRSSCDDVETKKSKKNKFWEKHVRITSSAAAANTASASSLHNSRWKKATKEATVSSSIVTPSPFLRRQSSHYSPSTITIDLLSSSNSIASKTSSSSGSSTYHLPEGVIDIDVYPSTECCTNCSRSDTATDLSQQYLKTYSKEYYNYLFSKEETTQPASKPRTRNRAKLEFQFMDQPCDYMSTQPYISKQMRAILVDWLIEVQEDLLMQESTLYLAVRLLDRALSCTGDTAILIEKENLQSLGCACMSLSSRLNEVSPPSTDEFEAMSDRACTTKEIYAMALRICKSLNFRLYTITPNHFCHRFLKACCLTIHNPVLDMMLHYLLQVAMLSYELAVLTKPSLVSASALFLARVALGIRNITNLQSNIHEQNVYWSKTLQYYTTYTPDDLKLTVKLIYAAHKNADEANIAGACTKYSDEKYFKVALKMMVLEEDLDLALLSSSNR